MGGSGGGYFRSDQRELKAKIDKISKASENSEYETVVSAKIDAALRDFNNRDTDIIATHLSEIQKAIENNIEGSIDLLFGGSISKNTFLNGLSDIDSLMILNNTELSQSSPGEIIDYVAQLIKERFPKTDISIGNLAVTIKFSDYDIQILPALRDNSGFVKIADKNGSKWIAINPERFKKDLTDVNKGCQGKLVPTIKIAKGILSKLPENNQLNGYHIEALALEAFREFKGDYKTSTMLRYFLKYSAERVLKPIADNTGQSKYVDEYLGKENSLNRQIISNGLQRICRKIRNADQSNSIQVWDDLIE